MKITILPLLFSVGVVFAAPAQADFYDDMTPTDPNLSRWWAADGWSNGLPFDTCWKKTQFARNSTGIATLNLATSTSCNRSTQGAEYRTKGYYGYGTYTFNLKAPAQTAGVVMGAFLYRGPSDNDNGNPTHNEIAIEFVNGKVQFNYFHNDVGGHEKTFDVTALGFDPRNGFHTYGFTWQKGSIQFLVDGKAKGALQILDVPSFDDGGMRIMVNNWKCLQAAWCGTAPTTLNTTGFIDSVRYSTQ